MPAISDTPGPNDLFDLAREYLEACKHALATSPGGPIERCFVSPGKPAWDVAPQLTVHVEGPEQANTSPLGLMEGQRLNVQGYLNMVVMTATVLRPVPVIADEMLPLERDIEAASVVILGDCWVLWNHVRAAVRTTGLFSYPDTRREVEMAPPTAVAIQGGVGGWEMSVRVRLDGYEENESHA